MSTLRRFSRVFDRISIYLPVILMGLLALGTYWLLRNTPAPAAPEQARPPRHEVDYFMQRFALRTFDASGRMKSELRGDEIRHFPDTDTLEIDRVHLRTFDDEGRLTVATADRGLSNGDGSEVQLFGNAIVQREASVDRQGKEQPRMELRSEFLHVISDTEKVRTHLPARLQRGQDEFTGDAMDYDNLSHQIELRGRVHGVLVPTPGRKP